MVKLRIEDVNTAVKRQDFLWFVNGKSELKTDFFSIVAERLEQKAFPETVIGITEEKIKKERRDLLTIDSDGYCSLAKIHTEVASNALYVMLTILPSKTPLNFFEYTNNVLFTTIVVDTISEILGEKPRNK